MLWKWILSVPFYFFNVATGQLILNCICDSYSFWVGALLSLSTPCHCLFFPILSVTFKVIGIHWQWGAGGDPFQFLRAKTVSFLPDYNQQPLSWRESQKRQLMTVQMTLEFTSREGDWSTNLALHWHEALGACPWIKTAFANNLAL